MRWRVEELGGGLTVDIRTHRMGECVRAGFMAREASYERVGHELHTD